MFISAKFNPDHARAYTYAYDGPEGFAPGDRVIVETKDGRKTVTVHEVDLPEPAFECKPILGRAEDVAQDDAPAPSGHNNPPDDLDDALAPFGDYITEAESWADGSPVENEGQMKAVDALIKQIKAAKKAVSKAEESCAKPIYDKWKAEKARFAPTLNDLDRLTKALVSIVSDFKSKLAAEKAAEARRKEQEAWEANRKAQEAMREAAVGDIEAQREADQIASAAKDAQKAASAAKNDTVKGMRKEMRYEIEDHRAALHHIAKHDRESVTAFVEEYVRRNYKTVAIDGVRVWEERVAL